MDGRAARAGSGSFINDTVAEQRCSRESGGRDRFVGRIGRETRAEAVTGPGAANEVGAGPVGAGQPSVCLFSTL